MKKIIPSILIILVLTVAGVVGVCSSNANNSQNLENPLTPGPIPTATATPTPTPTLEPCNESLSQTLTNNSWDIRADLRTRMGERFNSWPAGVITSIDCCLLKHGSPPGTFYVRVRRVSDDAILGTLGSKVASSLTNSYVWYTFNTSPVVIDVTEDIRIAVEWDGGDYSNHINSEVYNSNIYSGGMIFEYKSSYDGYSDFSTAEWTWRNLTYSTEPTCTQ